MEATRKVDELWWAGYCGKAVKYMKSTFSDPKGEQRRIAFIREHIKECYDCRLANVGKDMEAATAIEMGIEAELLFKHGGDITTMAGFQKAFEKVFPEFITLELVEFMQRIAERHGKPFEEDEHGKER
jgi:hypothetical protein